MSVAVVRKPSRHDGLPFMTAAEEFRDSANETTHSLLLVQLHRKSLLFLDIYYDRYGHHFTLMHDTGVAVGKTLPSKKTPPLPEHKIFGCRYLIRRGVHRKMVITRMYLRVRCMSLT